MTPDRTSWVVFDRRGFPIAFALADRYDEDEIRREYPDDRVELCSHEHVTRLLRIHAGEVPSAGTQLGLPL